jgi:hypothetical protein
MAKSAFGGFELVLSLSKHPAPAGREFTSNFRKNTGVQRAYHKKEADSGSVETTTCFFCASGRI